MIRKFLEGITKLTPSDVEHFVDYFNDISILADKEVGIQFKNEGKLHAAIVMTNIFNHAKEKINIFAGNFNGDVSNMSIYIEALENYILNNGKIDLIFEQTPSKDSKALDLLLKYKGNVNFSKNLTIKVATKQAIKKYQSYLKSSSSMVHFTTADSKMYRCELDTASYKALCNFDDKKFCSNLDRLHEILAEDASVYNFA